MAGYQATKIFILMLSMVFVLGCGGGGGIAQMEEGRGDHSATLLADGRLIVIGGRAGNVIKSVEVYDSVANEWSPASPMAQGRFAHSVTVLPSGLFLIVGGDKSTGANPLESAELYDPAKDTWTSAGDMAYKHGEGHTATLLNNGTVLVTGGPSLIEGTKRVIAFSEVYDPATNSWSSTGDMTEGRKGHIATLLDDGTVLVVGTESVEVYDPATGTWSLAAEFAESHLEQFTATKLNDGRVLVAGGGQKGKYLAPDTLNHVDIYDPSTGELTAANSMGAKRWDHTATVMSDGKLVMVGFKTAEIYDPATGNWTSAGEMPEGRGRSHTATLMSDGTILVVGGAKIDYTVAGLEVTRKGLTSSEVFDTAVPWEED